jgi:hypothetical protein
VITRRDVGHKRKTMANRPYPLGGPVIPTMKGTIPPIAAKPKNHRSNGLLRLKLRAFDSINVPRRRLKLIAVLVVRVLALETQTANQRTT